ncbi:YcnI family copper-binding membrane protein [Cellulomonas aerilata]|uniref:YncI copper-binding domain-containing protein n=1 Tax=Cellulomonas aerilata TaxID=515326 RepID=A0A512DBP1_9CELL|nr:YcnI family protein [Cellulomonas aerilata]GEO33650.1 hypothetical protein CAE01nite_13750 [Cellulomonas aerilata]
MSTSLNTRTPRTARRLPALALTATATAALLLAPASAASAHVRVLPDNTTAGGFAQLTFRVPTESDTAATVGVRVELPTDTPLTSVRTKPVPGWTAVVERGALPAPVDREGTTITEAPTAVVWTAQPGAEVGPGQYQEFSISVGPLPEAGTEVLLPATQSYSDGETVLWSEAPMPDGSEPELPAPVLVTTAAEEEGGDHHGAAPAADGGTDADEATTDGTTADAAAGTATGTAAGSSRDDTGARWLGGTGLALGAAALVTAAVRRRPAAPGTAS